MPRVIANAMGGLARLLSVLLVVVVLGGTPHVGSAQQTASEEIDASIAFSLEPRLANFRQNDDRLAEYGFQPVGSAFLPAYGLSALFWTGGGWRLGGAMHYGFRLSNGESSEVPTTTTSVTMAYTIGRDLGHGFAIDGNVGFASLTHTIGSRQQGGSLVYLGPFIQPTIAWRIPVDFSHVEFSAGYLLHFPIGDAHDNPLWEAEFARSIVHGLVIGLDMGARF